ncbi:MAG: type I restriction endonuclease subunit R, partial [Desulfuromonadales bacterium]|nr:type I restriction endonuclease subunit R [Desulfuromonadales bacterium]
MVFSEDSRVKIPCILHLVRLGYRYLSLKNAAWDEETNIFPDLFHSAMARINPGMETDDIERLLADVKLTLENEDLGKAFYEKLTERSSTRLIDFTNFSNNSFHVVTELTCKNGDDEFRPDITLLINGLPLAFIEVKRPNNREGVLAERNRIITRCRNPRFQRFLNITQLMVFSNNMEYDDGSPQPIEGAFYASPSYDAPIFNYFREEEDLDLAVLLADEDDAVENEVLKDNNLSVIKHSPEFISNKA